MSDAEALALVSIAELHKTVATLTQVMGRVLALLQKGVSVRRRLANAGITAANAASLWLEVRYGLRPLYYEVQDLVTALGSINGKFPRTRVTAAVFGSKHGIQNDGGRQLIAYKSCPAGPANVWGSFENIHAASAGALLQHTVDEISVGKLLGLNELSSTAWELVPFSFVVDWFLNTADLVAAWQPRLDTQVLASWVVHRAERRATRTCEFLNFKGSTGGIASDVHDSYVIKRTARYTNPTLSAVPRLNIRLNTAKLVDLIALLQGVNFSKWRI
jgi:uncharacterized small protein (DUF1192 family)